MKRKKRKNDELIDLLNVIDCPVCNESVIEHITDICPICGWEQDLVQTVEHDFEHGPNRLTVNQSKEFFKLKRMQDPNYTWKANAKEIGNPTKEDLINLRKHVESLNKK